MEWLSKQDEYVPTKDKDIFIDKTIISLLSVLSDIKRSSGNYSSKITPQVKFISTILIVILISASKSYKFLALLFVYLFIMIFQLKKEEIKKIFSVNLVIPIITSIALIPAIISGNVYNSLMLVIKTLAAVLIVGLLSYTTKWNDIAKALRMIHIPNIFIFILEITIRYIFILGEFSLEMFSSLRLKSVGKNVNKYMPLSSILGTLFMKSKYMGDELYAAMECRGFQGEYIYNPKFKLSVLDYVFIIFNIILILAFVIFDKV